MKKRILSIVLAAVLIASQGTAVFADEESDLQNQQSAAQNQLNNTYSQLDDLAVRQQQVQSEISDVNADLVDLMQN